MMSFKHLLVITDNSLIAKRFLEEIVPIANNKIEIQFACSPFSNIENFKKENIKIQEYDLRDKKNILEIIKKYDLIFSLHCKQLFPKSLIGLLKCINIHPGFNPINRGWYPQVFAIINNLPIGATIHEIDEELDHGPIIARRLVEKTNLDTSEILYKRILDSEIALLKENFESIINNTYKTIPPEKEGDIMLKKDFNKLLKLDLEERVTIENLINRLRALTHGDYKNAYFVDPDTKEKVYISIKLEKK